MAQGSLDEALATFSESDVHVSSNSIQSDFSVDPPAPPSRLNACAPEFIPRPANRSESMSPKMMIPQSPSFVSPESPLHMVSPANCGSISCFGGYTEEEALPSVADQDGGPVKNGLAEEVVHKVVNQVEYYFSDVNLATTDHLMRFINKDPDGFVPVPVVAAFKKIRSLVSSHSLLAEALRTSSKLVVSEDGKKVRRMNPFTTGDAEELQSRIVVAENLPEDHSHQKLMKIFSAVGSVISIRICPAQASNGTASVMSRSGKMDMFFSHKLHAFVEYSTIDLVEKAVAELNDEKNWRSGLRVRGLLACLTKSWGRRAGRDGDLNVEDDDVSTPEHQTEKQAEDLQSCDTLPENMGEEITDKESSVGRGRGRGRAKGRGRVQHYVNRGHVTGTPAVSALFQNDHPPAAKQLPGPRMPDGTRGFTMGRGKPASTAL